MGPQRWKQIDGVFAAALELDAEKRAAFLDGACAGDEQLRKEVESLLAHTGGRSLPGVPAFEEGIRVLAKGEERALPGDRIGHYQIIRSLGAGGMGEVYLAKDRLGRMVALKLLNRRLEGDESGVARFQQEARTLLALNHPHIVTIYDIDKTESVYYIASELVEGETIRQRLDRGDMELTVALDVAIQIVTALAAAHEKGIVHRDIKPENIMIRGDGFVKVLDFGIAKLTAGSVTSEAEAPTIRQVQTAEGTVIGTAPYMSPEQARGLVVDARTDIWSLGVVIYEAIAGRKPFTGETTQDVITSILEKEPAPLARYAHNLPEGLEWIVSRALRKEREARYQTATELLNDLKELKRKIEITKSISSQTRHGEAEPLEPASISGSGTAVPVADATSLSSAEYIVTEIKQHRLALLVGLLMLAAGAVILGVYWFPRNNTAPIQSIAVLPFVNASGNTEVEYLSDGMTDMLITSLSQVPKLSVKAHSSVFRYKGRDTSPQQVGKELNVQAILNGRMMQRGNDLTLHIELVDAATETALWSRDYSRSMTNLVALQAEIARDVSQNLRRRLSSADELKVTKDYTANAEAKDLYLRARFHIFKLTPPEITIGISYLQQAIQLDPNYALAYVGLSEAYRTMALGGEMNPADTLPKARAATQKALDIDDSLAEAHTSLGVSLFWYDWNWNESEKQYKRALELNPNNPESHLFYAHLLSNTGRHAEALDEIKRARELDPYSPFVNALEGEFLLHSGKPDEALARLREAIELAPGFWLSHVFASSAYIEKGMFAEAINEAHRAGELAGAQTVSIFLEGCALARMGRKNEARILLQKLLKLSKERFVPPAHIAILYNGLGEREEALAWLERGIEQRDPKMTFLKVEPKWSNLRGDPRFQEIMRRVGL